MPPGGTISSIGSTIRLGGSDKNDTKELIQAVVQANVGQEVNLSFELNEFFKGLGKAKTGEVSFELVHGFRGSKPETIVEFETMEQLKDIDPATRRLRFVGDRYEFDRDWVEVIVRRFPNLFDLDLREVRSLKANDIKPISKLSKLRSLRIRFAERMEVSAAKTIGQLKNLEVLDLSYSRNVATDQGMSELAGLQKLRTLILLRHSGGGVSGESHKHFQQMKNLREVFVTQQHTIAKSNIPGQSRYRVIVERDAPGNDWFSIHRSKSGNGQIHLRTSMRDLWRAGGAPVPFAQVWLNTSKIPRGNWKYQIELDHEIYHPTEAFSIPERVESDASMKFELRPEFWKKIIGHLSAADLTTPLELSTGQHQLRIIVTPPGATDALVSDYLPFQVLPSQNPKSAVEGKGNKENSTTESNVATDSDHAIILLLTADGKVKFAGETIDHLDSVKPVLQREIQLAKRKNKDIDQINVVIHGEKESPTALVQQLITICQQAGIQNIRLKPTDTKPDEVDHLRWTMFGKVTDEAGNPLGGVEVRMATGYATLLGGGSTVTQPDGSYVLKFGEGIWSSEGANTQIAWCFLSKAGYVYKSNSRNIDLTMYMARERPSKQGIPGRLTNPVDVIVRDQPQKMDLVMSRPAELLVRVVDPNGNRVKDSNIQFDDSSQSSEVVRVSLSEQEKTEFDEALGLATDRDWTLSVPILKKYRQKSGRLNFKKPGRYQALVELAKTDGMQTLTIRRVTDENGIDVTPQVLTESRTSRQPLPEDMQKLGREMIAKMSENNAGWLDVKNSKVAGLDDLSVLVRHADNQNWHENKKPSDLVPVHYSALHALAADPKQAVIRSIEINDVYVTIGYTLRKPVRVSFGNGVLGNYSGYTQTNVNEGSLTIDLKTHRPFRHESGPFTATFSNYKMHQGQWYPLNISFRGQWDMEWRFQVAELKDKVNLWIAHQLQPGDKEIVKVKKDGAELTLYNLTSPKK